MRKDSAIKQLHTQLSDIKGRLSAKKTELGNVQNDYQLLLRQEKSLAEKIEKLNNANVKRKCLVFSEHSLLQYLIRKKGVNLEDIEEELISEDAKKAIEFAKGNCTWTNATGTQIVIKNYKVVTIY